jgi:hypothetical protein
MTFPKHTAQIHITALEDIAEGEEITVAYVDIEQHADEDAAACRQRRRAELARGWKLGCACPRCVSEGEEVGKKSVPMDASISETGTSQAQAAIAAVQAGLIPQPRVPV